MKTAKYAFFDIETTARQPNNGEMISIAMFLTDKDYNIIGEFVEFCNLGGDRFINDVFGREVNRWPDPTHSTNPAEKNSTDVHGITWDKAVNFQKPIDLYRKLYSFLLPHKDSKPTLVFHSNTQFDPKWLWYRSKIWAEPMYALLNKMFTGVEFDVEGNKLNPLRYEDTMSMAQDYIRSGKDILKEATKQQKIIDKMDGYLTKQRKVPAKPEKIQEWQKKKEDAIFKLDNLSHSQVELKGYSLDKICSSLNIPLKHHCAKSDAEVLIPIHKFLSA